MNRILQGDTEKSFEEIVDDVEAVMKESVAMHKISDVEVASYLSSGVDSSYLTYLGQVDRTFTVGFDEGKYSEIQDAKEFAASINMKNDAKVISPEEYWDKLSGFPVLLLLHGYPLPEIYWKFFRFFLLRRSPNHPRPLSPHLHPIPHHLILPLL